MFPNQIVECLSAIDGKVKKLYFSVDRNSFEKRASNDFYFR